MCGQREAPCQGPGLRGPQSARTGQARRARTLDTGRQREPARCGPELRRRSALRALWEPRLAAALAAHPSAGAIFSGAEPGCGWLSTVCVGSGRVSHAAAASEPRGNPSAQRSHAGAAAETSPSGSHGRNPVVRARHPNAPPNRRAHTQDLIQSPLD